MSTVCLQKQRTQSSRNRSGSMSNYEDTESQPLICSDFLEQYYLT